MLGKVRSGSGTDRNRKWDSLGFYPGTLNILLDMRLPPTTADFYRFEFACVKGKLNGIDCYVCADKELTDKRLVFILAEWKLRDLFNLEDGDYVNVEIKRG